MLPLIEETIKGVCYIARGWTTVASLCQISICTRVLAQDDKVMRRVSGSRLQSDVLLGLGYVRWAVCVEEKFMFIFGEEFGFSVGISKFLINKRH